MRVVARPRRVTYGLFFCNVGLKEKLPGANTPYLFKSVLRVLQVVQQAVAQHQVEGAELAGIQIIDIRKERGCIRRRVAGFLDHVESPYGVGERINPDNFTRPSFFSFERKEAFSTSNVENS